MNQESNRIRVLIPRSKRHRWVGAGTTVSLMLLALGCGPSDPLIRAERASHLHLCRPERLEEAAYCGVLEVPEDAAGTSERVVALSVAVIPATGKDVPNVALVDLTGGPGGSNSASMMFYRLDGSGVQHRKHRDVLIMDYRGTGASMLDCEAFKGQRDFEYALPVQRVAACREELEAEADLTRYTTNEIVEDLERVRSWLGYEQLDLVAYSYGTRIALEYARRYAAHARTLTLIGTVPPKFGVLEHHVPNTESLLNRLFLECSADPACDTAFPDLRAKTFTVRDRLTADSVVVPLDPGTPDAVEVFLTAELFETWLVGWVSSGTRWHTLPGILHAAASGDYEPLARTVSGFDTSNRPLHLSQYCPEEVRRTPVPLQPVERSDKLLRGVISTMYREACSAWIPLDPPSWLDQPLARSVPTLLLSGSRDPTTPPSAAELVARTGSLSRHVVIPNGGHNWYFGAVSCLDSMISEFHAGADPRAVDTSCLAEHSPRAFLTDPDPF